MSGAEITDTSALPYTDEDVAFMSGMIAHHVQALEMTALIAERTQREDLHLLGRRINVSQTSEIQLMQKWLRDRDQPVPEATSVHMMNGQPMLMPGMLTKDDMDLLAVSSGDEFYKQFLTSMIRHHQGAITMVEQLLSATGAAQDTYVFRFATDVDVDQRMEITRMQDMVDALH
jgi:uncharacterized protein (DUF305 family)